MRIRTLVGLAVLGTCFAAPLQAQEASEQPITRYVLDLRAALPKFPSTNDLASPYGLATSNLPGLGLGASIGAHVYPLRWRHTAIGVGVNGVIGRGHASAQVQPDGTVVGKDVSMVLTSFSPQISINFGSAAGWSYLSGGISQSRLTIETADTVKAGIEYPARKTLDYGGGGRWFLTPHMAATFDIRFYTINPTNGTMTVMQAPRTRMMVISMGISLR